MQLSFCVVLAVGFLGEASLLQTYDAKIHLTRVKFLRAGNKLIVSGLGAYLAVFDSEKGEERVLEGHDSSIHSFSVCQKQEILASIDHKGNMIIWDLKTFELLSKTKTKDFEVFFLSQNRLATRAVGHAPHFWDVSNPRKPIKEEKQPLFGIKAGICEVSPDGQFIALGYTFIVNGKDGKAGDVIIRSVVDGKIVRKLGDSENDITSLAFSNNGKQLAIGSSDVANGRLIGALAVWGIENEKKYCGFLGHKRHITALAFSTDSNLLFSSSYDGSIGIWNLVKERRLGISRAHRDVIFSLSVSPDGKSLASCSFDRFLKVWNIESLMK